MEQDFNIQYFVDSLVPTRSYPRYIEFLDVFSSVTNIPELNDFFYTKFKHIYINNEYIGWFDE